MSEITRSDAICYEQMENGQWLATFAEPTRDFGMWGIGATPFEAVDDLSQAISAAAQIFSEPERASQEKPQ